MQAEESAIVNEPEPAAAAVAVFVRRALGLQFEMRFEWETQWWPLGAQEVAETLLGYYDSMHSCLEQMREGKEVPSGLSYFRVRR